MFDARIEELAHEAVTTYARSGRKIVTAESCTGGLIAGALTEIPGSSAVVERGFVTYSNESKIELLDVENETLSRFGAVSAETAEEMAAGALAHSRADVALSVTGIAGPDGGTAQKPVGLVFFGLATRDGVLLHYQCQFMGNRNDVRRQCVAEGLKLLLSVGEKTALA